MIANLEKFKVVSYRSRNYKVENVHSKSPRIRNSVFASQVVQFLVRKKVFQIEAGWFLKYHIRNSLILQGISYQERFCHAISLH